MISFPLFGVSISMGVDDFVAIFVALGLAAYLIFCLVRPDKI